MDEGSSMAAAIDGQEGKEAPQLTRKEKRKSLKKLRRKQKRQQAAEEEKAAESAFLEDGGEAEQVRIQLEEEQHEAELLSREREEHDEQERLWLEREKKAMDDFQLQQQQLISAEEDRKLLQGSEEDWRYAEGDGPAEIIWQGNEIIVRKRRDKILTELPVSSHIVKDESLSASNPLPPQSVAFAAHSKNPRTPDANEQDPIFGTEQDKTHCPFHIKTGVCRFGVRCSRVHVYPDKSFTLLMRHMYNGPGLSWENDEGLEHSEEEVAQHYEEFYEDVHSEFLPYGELVNFKVCKNASSHLRGNVYVHYRTEASAQAAYSAMNGRFFAGKQITCEFVGVTRWRVALCGEFMKGYRNTCSRGSACNFLHCFRNPHGEYDWADWETRPPRYWLDNMEQLFGHHKSDLREDDHEHEEARRSGRFSRSPRRRDYLHRYNNDLREDDDENKEARRSGRYSRSPRRGDSVHREHRSSSRNRFYPSSLEDVKLPSRHTTERRRHESGGELHYSDSDAVERYSRHRRNGGRDRRHLSTSKEVGERDRRNGRYIIDKSHSSDDEKDGDNDHYWLSGEDGYKQQEVYLVKSRDVDEECNSAVIKESRHRHRRDRSHSPSGSIHTADKADHQHKKRRSSRSSEDDEHYLPLDLRSRKVRLKSSGIGIDPDQLESQDDPTLLEEKGAQEGKVKRRKGHKSRKSRKLEQVPEVNCFNDTENPK